MKVTRLEPPRSIAGRLLLFSALFMTITLVVASVVLWFALKNVVREQIDQRLDTQINALANGLTANPNDGVTLPQSMDAPPFDRPGSGWYWQIEANGQRLTSRSLSRHPIEAPPAPQSLRHVLTGMASPGEGKDAEGQALYTRRVTRNIDGTLVTIVATAPFTALVGPALRALLWLVPSMLLLGAILMAGTFWQIRFGLRPLSTMVTDIDAINRGEMMRLPKQKSPELAPLSEKANALLVVNEERLAETRLQFANLAHALKTPVASLLLALNDSNDPDAALRGLGKRIDHRIKHHLSAARHAMAPGGSIASANVASSVKDVFLVINSIHADRNLRFETDMEDGLNVACDERDLEEMLGNLIENAFKWASSEVTVKARKESATAMITVVDDGAGIAPDRMEAVLLPGVREDERVAGSGFGLTIVSELATLYGGSLALEANTPKGLRAILKLPASNRAAQ